MNLGYINFSSEEQLKMRQVIQAIQEHQAIDELGLGRIRDAFSNKLFPGISTLHKRAKYYAILPSLFWEAEKGLYKSANEVRAKVLNLEIMLTRQLLRGTDSINNWGITGSSVVDAAEVENSRYVKYDPVYIYYGALVSYGMILTSSNIYSLIYERSKTFRKQPPKYISQDEEKEMGDSELLSGNYQIFDCGGLSYTFDGYSPINIDLTFDEAKFIKEKIVVSPIAKDSFLATILRDDYPIGPAQKSYFDLGELWKKYMTEEHYMIYTLSVRISKFQYLLRLVYNYVFYSRTDRTEEAQKDFERYEQLKEEWKADICERSIFHALDFVGSTIQDNGSIKFCKEACSLINSSSHESFLNLQEIIINREKQTKGSSRSKLANPNKYKGIDRIEAYFFDYRWGTVYNIISEIKKGLSNG